MIRCCFLGGLWSLVLCCYCVVGGSSVCLVFRDFLGLGDLVLVIMWWGCFFGDWFLRFWVLFLIGF